MENQKQVWNKIAPDWNKFKRTPDQRVVDFIEKTKGNLLDLGCGSGRNFAKIDGIIYGVDFSEEMIKFAKKKAKKTGIKVNLIKRDIFNLPYKDNFFAAAINVATLHCVEKEANRKKTLKELYRVLKPKAKMLIKVWNKEHRRFNNKGKESYIQWLDKGKRYYYFYTEDELKKELEKTGFKILFSKSKEKERSLDEIFIIAQKP